MQGTIIQSDAKICNPCIVNTVTSIDHECKLADFVHISLHATLCGNVHIGKGSWIGAGATLIPGIKIGEWSVVAGATVIRDVPPHTTVAGLPAKPIRKS